MSFGWILHLKGAAGWSHPPVIIYLMGHPRQSVNVCSILLCVPMIAWMNTCSDDIADMALIWKAPGWKMSPVRRCIKSRCTFSPPFIIWQKPWVFIFRNIYCVLSGMYRMLWFTSILTKHLGLEHTRSHTRFQPSCCPVWVSVLWSRPSALSCLLPLSPVVLHPSGGLPPPRQSGDQLERFAFNF